MIRGKDFEVSKEVYERAKARYMSNHNGDEGNGVYYMTSEDEKEIFNISVLCGYGLYDCKVREKDGKYICSYMTGSSCD